MQLWLEGAESLDFAKRADRVWKTSDHDVAVVQLDDFHGQDEAISLVGMIDWILVRCSDWTMIPLENIVAAAAGSGTRIAAFVPNCIETVILMLAATASGAIWTSCSPDFGSQGVIDRFGQVEPSLLIVANGYNYNGKTFGLEDKINGVLDKIDTIENVISIKFAQVPCNLSHNSVIEYTDLLSDIADSPEFVQLPFDHPLYIMYSSGTTGPPKSIVHSAGGTLIQHLKEHQLQCDIQSGRDTLFWFTTCGWMMWNWLVSGLASGATIVLYDGSPAVSYTHLRAHETPEHRVIRRDR